MRKRRLIMMLAVVAMVMGAMAPASAGAPQCSDVGGFANHGDHITSDYVNPGGPGPAEGARGRPAHFTVPATPGATFCGTHGQGGDNANQPSGP